MHAHLPLHLLSESCKIGSLNGGVESAGHLGSSLGVAELTVALHYVFNAPFDKIIWDVGHQAYGHKILTGRREGMDRIRQRPGLSGTIPVSALTKTSVQGNRHVCFLHLWSANSVRTSVGLRAHCS